MLEAVCGQPPAASTQWVQGRGVTVSPVVRSALTVDRSEVRLPVAKPLVVFSLCAGLIPELEVLLQLGFHIRAAYAIDEDKSLEGVWRELVVRLRRQYASQLSAEFGERMGTQVLVERSCVHPQGS